MPNFDWQPIVVTVTLIVAASYLVHRGLKTFRSSRRRGEGANLGAGSCGTCGACSAGGTGHGNSTAEIVPLADLTASKTIPSSLNDS
jgi:hypothetical protein